MAIVTIYRLAEQVLSLVEGGDMPAASSISINEVKLAINQIINKFLKTDYISTNIGGRELIPNGSVLALYENISVEKWGDRSRSSLPVKPLKLPRDIGVYSVYPSGKPDEEFIPVQIGQTALLKSQPMINDMLGQICRQTEGLYVVYNKDLTSIFPSITVDMKLVVMDISQYSDFDVLPIIPEWESDIIMEAYKMFSSQPIPDKVVDSTQKELIRNPINNQTQPE